MSELSFEEIRSFKKSHCLNRLFERFAIQITEEEYQEIVFEIREYINEPIYVNPENGKSFHIVNFGKDACVFLYDWEYETLLTVFYLRFFTKRKDGFYDLKKRKLRKSIRSRDRYRTYMQKLGVTVE